MHGRFALQIWLLGLLLTVDVEAQDTFIREVMPETREELLLRITRHTPVYGLAVAQDGVFAAASDVLRVWDGISGSSLVSLVGLYASPFQAADCRPFRRRGDECLGDAAAVQSKLRRQATFRFDRA